jgi:hypothetical protein
MRLSKNIENDHRSIHAHPGHDHRVKVRELHRRRLAEEVTRLFVDGRRFLPLSLEKHDAAYYGILVEAKEAEPNSASSDELSD